MRTFNELNEAYERTMLARAEPEKGERMEKPKGAEIYDWEQFLEWAKSAGVDLDFEKNDEVWWDCWKEGYVAGVESTTED